MNREQSFPLFFRSHRVSVILNNKPLLFVSCRYRKILNALDLRKDFFFSYSYHIMRSLQKNLADPQDGWTLYETIFVWNEYLTRRIRNCLRNTLWTVALVHGFFKQVHA